MYFNSISFPFYFSGISSIEIGPFILNPSLPVLGDEDFALQCTFTLSSNSEQLQGIILGRKRTEDPNFFNILTIPPPSLSAALIKYDDPSLKARTFVKGPDTGLSTSISVRFYSTMCSDIGEYKFGIDYYSSGLNNTERHGEVKLKGKFLTYSMKQQTLYIKGGTDYQNWFGILVL